MATTVQWIAMKIAWIAMQIAKLGTVGEMYFATCRLDTVWTDVGRVGTVIYVLPIAVTTAREVPVSRLVGTVPSAVSAAGTEPSVARVVPPTVSSCRDKLRVMAPLDPVSMGVRMVTKDSRVVCI
jgi:hypothetical protein